jgi:4-hydroxybenzoate polyprenyltransferase/phosphoserine phosphatase
MNHDLPLCVDCDGTLIRTDLLHESLLLLSKRSWSAVLALPFWLLKGKAHFKQRVAERVTIDFSTLPYNEDVLKLIRDARASGQTTVLATAAPLTQAEGLARHLGLFDRIEATSETVNLAGTNKAERLAQAFGRGGFAYAGNSKDDLPVWRASGGAIVVSSSASLRRAASKAAPMLASISCTRAGLTTYAKAIRVHQWLKNLLVFVPLLAAHQVWNGRAAADAALAFVAFSLCSSAVYVTNDLLDLRADREHHRKRFRPFASGTIPISTGILMAAFLLAASAALCARLPLVFRLTVATYFALTCLYTFWLKHQVVVDVMLLASLYTSRIIAGAAATSIVPSFWLLAFAIFVFLSLAIVKRYSEMLVAKLQNKTMAAGRGYMVSDMPVLMCLGAAAGYNAVLIMALYVHSTDVEDLYPQPWALWAALPPLLYWISRIWMKAHRGEVHDDPVVFAATDKQSWLLGGFVVCALFWASHG